MSRLHTLQADIGEVARHFQAEVPDGFSIPRDTTEGCPGVVVIKRDGRRYLRNYSWGFPRFDRERAERGDPPEPLGLVANVTSRMWEKYAPDPRYRCLIALSHFANPDGTPGSMTRTWFSVEDEPIIAWAGFCRNTLEFGPVYAGLTRDENGAIKPTNERMPVILMSHQYDDWLHGSVEEIITYQFGPTIAPERIVADRTADLWRSEGLPTRQGSLL